MLRSGKDFNTQSMLSTEGCILSALSSFGATNCLYFANKMAR